MTRITLADAKKSLPTIVRKAGRRRSPLIVTEDGKDVAAILSMSQLRKLEEQREDEDDVQIVAERIAEKCIPYDEVRKRLGLP